jgi:hypothetical protein
VATIKIPVPEALRQRMDKAAGEDWPAIARQAFEAHLERLALRERADAKLRPAIDRLQASKARYNERQKNASFGRGYAWARDRAEFHDLQQVVDAPDYRAAADVVRRTRGFSQRDEFGDAALPSDEMWEGFVDGAAALYGDIVDNL